jgi:tetratricopeptide (TPR) repeat protein
MRAMNWAVAAVLVLAGCASQKQSGGARGVSKQSANQLDSEHSSFETAQDPPINANTHFAAGQLNEAENQPAKAIEQYKAALKLKPDLMPAMFQLGSLYTQLGMYPEAIETWQKYVKATNGSAAAYSNLGFCYELAHRPREAEAAYKQGIASNPHEQPVRVNYGLMLVRQGRMEEAIAQLSAVLSPAEVHYNIGSVYEQQGKIDQARAEYQKALLLDPSLHDAAKRLKGLK